MSQRWHPTLTSMAPQYEHPNIHHDMAAPTTAAGMAIKHGTQAAATHAPLLLKLSKLRIPIATAIW